MTESEKTYFAVAMTRRIVNKHDDKILAIFLIRLLYKCNLKQAKELVEIIADEPPTN